MSDDYVAWCRYSGKTIVTCDSDDDGAFKVYRGSPADEKRRRIYYQDIVYNVCRQLDKMLSWRPGHGIVCGTADEPSRGTEETLCIVLDIMERAVVALHMQNHAHLNHPTFNHCREGLCGDWYRLKEGNR